jgi:hypothetical protein
VVWYRPPYGRFTTSAWTTVTDAGMTTACWSCDVHDWDDVSHEERLANLDSISRAGEIVLSHDAFADARDLADDGPPPPVDRGLLARDVLERVSSDGCSRPILSEAFTRGTPVWQSWVADES